MKRRDQGHRLLHVAVLLGMILPGLPAAADRHAASPSNGHPGGRIMRLTLSQALSRARNAPQQVLAALATRRAREASVNAAQAAFWPRLSLSASAQLRHQSLEQPPPPTSGGTGADNAAASADLTMFDFGRRQQLLEASEHERRAAVAGTTSARLQAQLTTSEAYLRVLAADRTADAFEVIVGRRRAMLQVTGRLVTANLKPEVDKQRALLEVVSAQADLESWRNRSRSEQAALAAALALPVETELRLVQPSPGQLAVNGTMMRAADTLVCGDPYLAGARERARAAASTAVAVDRAVLPALVLQARVGYNVLDELYGSLIQGVGSVAATSFDASATLMVRWDGLDATLWHRADEAQQQAEAARRAAGQVSIERQLLARQTALEIQNGRTRVAQQEQALEVAHRAFAIQDNRYRNRLASMLEVLDSREALDRTELGLISSRLEFDLARARLRLLTPACAAAK